MGRHIYGLLDRMRPNLTAPKDGPIASQYGQAQCMEVGHINQANANSLIYEVIYNPNMPMLIDLEEGCTE